MGRILIRPIVPPEQAYHRPARRVRHHAKSTLAWSVSHPRLAAPKTF
jgi:hypothetical protein